MDNFLDALITTGAILIVFGLIFTVGSWISDHLIAPWLPHRAIARRARKDNDLLDAAYEAETGLHGATDTTNYRRRNERMNRDEEYEETTRRG